MDAGRRETRDERWEVKHKMSVRTGGGEKTSSAYRSLIKQAVRVALLLEGVDLPCEVNVLITSNKVIRGYNRKFRDIDKATDVLSFPMLEYTMPGWLNRIDSETDRNTGVLPLGDIIISIEKARKQAKDYGHTLEQETTYLIIHSVLHLLGYDHEIMPMEKMMRFKEKQIMNEMGYLDI